MIKTYKNNLDKTCDKRIMYIGLPCSFTCTARRRRDDSYASLRRGKLCQFLAGAVSISVADNATVKFRHDWPPRYYWPLLIRLYRVHYNIPRSRKWLRVATGPVKRDEERGARANYCERVVRVSTIRHRDIIRFDPRVPFALHRVNAGNADRSGWTDHWEILTR